MKTESFHNAVSSEEYARLVRLFGEEEHGDTCWVTIGAGSIRLTFFAPRVSIVPPSIHTVKAWSA